VSTAYVSGRKEKALAAMAANAPQATSTKVAQSAETTTSINPAQPTTLQTTKSKRYEAARYFIFVVFFCVSAFINSNSQFFWFKNAISNVIMSKDVQAVVSRDSFWEFAASSEPGSFLSNFYAVIDQFDFQSNTYVKSGGSIFLISPLRIRTLRVIPGSCFAEGFDSANLTRIFGTSKTCHPPFSLNQESKVNYGVGRTFSWSESSLIDRYVIADFGELAYYPGGGYHTDVFANNAREAGALMRNLQHSAFIDGNTSYVALEFNVFAPLAMVYLPVRIYFEFPSIGGAIMGFQLSPTSIFRYASAQGRIIQGIDAILIVYFILYSLHMIKSFWSQGFLKYLKLSQWNTFDFVSNISLMVNLGLRFQMYQQAQALNLGDPRIFTEISQFVVFEKAITAANAFTLLLVLVRICFFYGNYVPKANLIISSCEYALSNLIVCSCVLVATFIAFAASFYACFGSEIASYRTFGSACLSMLKALMGNMDDMVSIPHSGFPVIGPLMIGSFSVCMFFILVNLFVAIIVDAFAATKSSWKQHEKNEALKKHAAQEQIVGNLRKTFEADLSDDDVIDREELALIVSNYKELLGFDTVDEFLRRYDENQDGSITRSELVPVLAKLDSDLAAIKNEGVDNRGNITNQGMVELFEVFDQSMNDKLASYTESIMRMIEQRSFGGGNSVAMGMGFEGGQGIIPVQANRSRDMLSQQDNLVASLIGTVKAKSQFMSVKNRCEFFVKNYSTFTNPFSRFNQRKSSSSSLNRSPTKGLNEKNQQGQRQQSDDGTDMEASLGPQHGKFEAKSPEIEELKVRVEALQAQVRLLHVYIAQHRGKFLLLSVTVQTFQIAMSELRLISVMEQLFQVGEFLRGSKVPDILSKFHATKI
jgi:hypothetical protein